MQTRYGTRTHIVKHAITVPHNKMRQQIPIHSTHHIHRALIRAQHTLLIAQVVSLTPINNTTIEIAQSNTLRECIRQHSARARLDEIVRLPRHVEDLPHTIPSRRARRLADCSDRGECQLPEDGPHAFHRSHVDEIRAGVRVCDLERVDESDRVPREAAAPDDRAGAGDRVGPGGAAGGVIAVDEEAGVAVQTVRVDEFELVQGAGGAEMGVAVGAAVEGYEGGEAVHAVAIGEVVVGFVRWGGGIGKIPESA